MIYIFHNNKYHFWAQSVSMKKRRLVIYGKKEWGGREAGNQNSHPPRYKGGKGSPSKEISSVSELQTREYYNWKCLA